MKVTVDMEKSVFDKLVEGGDICDLTHGKVYDANSEGKIEDDSGYLIYIRSTGCSHLCGNNWKVVND